MPGRIRFLSVAVILPIVMLSSSHAALAQWNEGYGRFGGYGGFGGRVGFFDSGIGAFGGGRYPGYAFGYDPRYLASRAFTAGGLAGSVTYAVTTQAAMHALPQDQWGVVVVKRRELYGNPKAYLHQLQQ